MSFLLQEKMGHWTHYSLPQYVHCMTWRNVSQPNNPRFPHINLGIEREWPLHFILVYLYPFPEKQGSSGEEKGVNTTALHYSTQ